MRFSSTPSEMTTRIRVRMLHREIQPEYCCTYSMIPTPHVQVQEGAVQVLSPPLIALVIDILQVGSAGLEESQCNLHAVLCRCTASYLPVPVF